MRIQTAADGEDDFLYPLVSSVVERRSKRGAIARNLLSLYWVPACAGEAQGKRGRDCQNCFPGEGRDPAAKVEENEAQSPAIFCLSPRPRPAPGKRKRGEPEFDFARNERITGWNPVTDAWHGIK